MYRERELKKRKRIGNICVVPRGDDDRYAYEVLMYYPNPYYGHEKDFVKVDGTDYYEYPDNPFCKIHEGCFKNEESCYVVAFITNAEEPDVVSVGLRPWELKGSDDIAFREILKYVFDNDEEDDCEEGFEY